MFETQAGKRNRTQDLPKKWLLSRPPANGLTDLPLHMTLYSPEEGHQICAASGRGAMAISGMFRRQGGPSQTASASASQTACDSASQTPCAG